MWIGREARLSENLDMHQFVLVLRWLQIRFSTWFTDQHREPVHISVPDFTLLITRILYDEAWEPTLPSRYQAIVPGLARHPAPAPAPAPRPPTTPARRAPGAPGNPAPAPAPAATGGRGDRVSNNSAHFAFTPFCQLNLPLGTVREKAKEANKPMPTNDMQLSFVCPTTSLVSAGKTAGAKRTTGTTTHLSAQPCSLGAMNATAKEARCDG
jgi:hypothetical protein